MKRCPVNSKGMTRTKELIQGWKRSEILIVNTIRKSDLYVSEYRPVDSCSRWSSVAITVDEAKIRRQWPDGEWTLKLRFYAKKQPSSQHAQEGR